jgi:hypothetical protein
MIDISINDLYFVIPALVYLILLYFISKYITVDDVKKAIYQTVKNTITKEDRFKKLVFSYKENKQIKHKIVDNKFEVYRDSGFYTVIIYKNDGSFNTITVSRVDIIDDILIIDLDSINRIDDIQYSDSGIEIQNYVFKRYSFEELMNRYKSINGRESFIEINEK